jgi:DNA-binding transcriptional LysR family regulator
VRDLERALGVALLERTSRSTSLTEAGAAVVEHGRALLDAAQRLRAAAELAARDTRGEVVVAFLASTVTSFLTPLVQRLSAEHPELELRVTQLSVRGAIAGLREGSVDVAIARRPDLPEDLVAQRLVVEPLVVAIPRGHRWARRRRVRRAEVHDEPLVLLEPRFWTPSLRTGMQRARAGGRAPEVTGHAPSHASAVALVAAGAGVYPLPASAAVARDDVRYVEIADAGSEVVLLRRAAAPTSATAAVAGAAAAVAAEITFSVPGLPPLPPRKP